MNKFLITYEQDGIYRFFSEDNEIYNLQLSTFGDKTVDKIIWETEIQIDESTLTSIDLSYLDISDIQEVYLRQNDSGEYVLYHNYTFDTETKVINFQPALEENNQLRIIYLYKDSFYVRDVADANLRIETFDLANTEGTEEIKTFELDTTENVFGYEIDQSFVTAGEEVVNSSFNVEGGRAIVVINAPIPDRFRVQFSYYGSAPLVEKQSYSLTINDQTETFVCNMKNDTLYLGDYDYFIETGEEVEPSSEDIVVDSTGRVEISEHIDYSKDKPIQYKILLQEGQETAQEFYLLSKQVVVDEQTQATAAYVGNLSRYDSEKEDTGEPFCIITRELGEEEKDYETFFYADEGSYKLTLELYKTSQIPELAGVALVSFGNKQYDETEQEYKIENNYGIGINSGDTRLTLPPRAISLFETELKSTEKEEDKISFNYRGILGTLPEDLNMEDGIKTHMKNTQGIYTDNMYIGDASQYLAFYTDKDGKHLDISGSNINVALQGNNIIQTLNGDETTVQLNANKINTENMVIGKEDATHIHVTDEEIQFWSGIESDDSNKTAYVTGMKLYIPYSVVLEEMIVGQSKTNNNNLWAWRVTSNEHLRLVWLGEEGGVS